MMAPPGSAGVAGVVVTPLMVDKNSIVLVSVIRNQTVTDTKVHNLQIRDIKSTRNPKPKPKLKLNVISSNLHYTQLGIATFTLITATYPGFLATGGELPGGRGEPLKGLQLPGPGYVTDLERRC